MSWLLIYGESGWNESQKPSQYIMRNIKICYCCGVGAELLGDLCRWAIETNDVSESSLRQQLMCENVFIYTRENYPHVAVLAFTQ